jgi:hypothetical protein
MSIFSSLFRECLEEEICVFKEYTSYQGFPNVFGSNAKLEPKERHRATIPNDPKFRQNPQLVPTMHKVDMSKIQKVEQAKTGQRVVLMPADIQPILQKYNINSPINQEPKKLGNTGVTIFLDPQLNKYVLKKI